MPEETGLTAGRAGCIGSHFIPYAPAAIPNPQTARQA